MIDIYYTNENSNRLYYSKNFCHVSRITRVWILAGPDTTETRPFYDTVSVILAKLFLLQQHLLVGNWKRTHTCDFRYFIGYQVNCK